MQVLDNILIKMTDFLFGPYMLVVFFGTGLYLTIRTKGIQFRKFGLAMRTMFSRKQRDDSDGEIRSFWALASALSSCIGIANIAGVAAALAVGSPGAVFWMWVAALLGMATKYCEITLALYTREKDENGVWHGGAMYLLKNGFKKQNPITKFLAGFFALATTFVGLVSCNMLQTNAVVSSLSPYNVNPYLIGIIFAVLCGIVIIGGVKRLGRVTSILTPTMGCIYVLAALVILVLNADGIIPGLKLIVTSAFTGTAAVGGFSGAAVSFAIRQGVARGIMSNEAGIGSSAMIHATATVKHPCEQGIFGILEVFFDTIVVCTMTALVIISTGVWSSGETSAALSGLAFSTGLPGEWGQYHRYRLHHPLRLFHPSGLVLVRRDRCDLPLRRQGHPPLPVCMVPVCLPGRYRGYRHRLARGGHRQRPDGHPQPDQLVDLRRHGGQADQRILQQG